MTERRIWKEGISNWKIFSDLARSGELPRWIWPEVEDEVERSLAALREEDHHFFRDRLSHREYWRAFPEFRNRTVYLDIETTGLDFSDNEITVVGLFDGKEVKTFINGKNLDEMIDELKKYSAVVTFNGILFDLPFISTKYPEAGLDQIQLDLRFILQRIGLRGGLKNIEHKLNITRTSETTGLTGYDAVRLWKKYEKGNDDALELLIKYNTEDIVNLEKLMVYAYDKLKEQTFNY